MKGLLNKYYSNFRHPQGLIGKYVVHKMNGKKPTDQLEIGQEILVK